MCAYDAQPSDVDDSVDFRVVYREKEKAQQCVETINTTTLQFPCVFASGAYALTRFSANERKKEQHEEEKFMPEAFLSTNCLAFIFYSTKKLALEW